MKHGVLFEINGIQKHSDDFGLVLNPVNIPTAKPRTSFITVEGASGSLDASEVLGLQYEDVSFSLPFTMVKWNQTTFDNLKAFLHGKRGKVTLYSDTNYYRDCRFTVSDASDDAGHKTLKIDCRSKPYKFKQDITSIVVPASATGNTVTLTNAVMPTVPTFTGTASMKITVGTKDYNISSGTHTLPDIVLMQGNTDVTITSSASVTITWKEGML